jgi:glycosyltransferase involved in cell wall biosynthesis
MKILHIVKTVTGATWVYHQVRVLCSLGFEIVVALPSATAGLAPKYQEAGATVIPINLDVPTRQPWQIPAVLKSCRTLVQTVRPDIIHTHHVGTTLVVRAALGKSSPIPRIFQVPGTLHLEHSFFAHLDTSLAGPRDHWIAACRWTQRKYDQLGVSPQRVSLSYLGTDLSTFTRTRRNVLRRELGLAPETPLVGMVCYMYAPKRFLGQTAGLKGHEDFIAAFPIAKKRIPNLHGVIIGGAWNGAASYEKHLRELGRRACNGSLAFLGTRSDVPALYPDLDLAVVPSHTENIPFAAIEALLSDVPVVTTNVGGLPDLVQEGVSGRLVPPRNPRAIAAAIVDSLQNRVEARHLTIKGEEMARHLFDVKRTTREVAQIYTTIISRAA